MSFGRPTGYTQQIGMRNQPAPQETYMSVAGKTVLITGASGGIGRELVNEALRRGCTRERVLPWKPETAGSTP